MATDDADAAAGSGFDDESVSAAASGDAAVVGEYTWPDFLRDHGREDAADELAERAQAIGGVPLSGGAAYEAHAPIEPEGEDVYGIRTSLENDVEAFGVIIESIRDHIGLTNELGDYATEELLRDTLETVEEHAHHLEHYLEDDSLVLESATN